MKIISIIIFLILSFSVSLEAHQRAKYDIVIDTDCGMDDFRALNYFLSSRDFNINAIMATGGVLDSETSASCVSMLLSDLHHEGIWVQKGLNAKGFKENCKRATDFWKLRQVPQNLNEDAVFKSIMQNDKKTIYVALGPLTNLAKLVETKPQIMSQISYVIWVAHYGEKPSGFNLEMDKKAYETVAKTGMQIKIADANGYSYSVEFQDFVSQINTVYAQEFVKFHEGKSLSDVRFFDDILPFYILYPELFSETALTQNVSFVMPKSDSHIEMLATGILNSTETEKGVIMTQLPRNGYQLTSDVEPLAMQIIEKYGYSEYKLVLLTSEMHSHLGIYSIIGAKMGLRILEYLHVGLDEISVESYAGSMPPLSCINDGLQIGAGTTLGYGAIKIVEQSKSTPSVYVNYNGRKFLFKVKDSISEEISADVLALVKKHGLESDVYWSEIRRLSIEKYWSEKSRFEIFDVVEFQ